MSKLIPIQLKVYEMNRQINDNLWVINCIKVIKFPVPN